MTQPPPRRPPRARRPFRPRLTYLIPAILALPIVFGFGALLLLILLTSHSTDSSNPPHPSSIPAITQQTPPSPIPSPKSCYPFQPNC